MGWWYHEALEIADKARGKDFETVIEAANKIRDLQFAALDEFDKPMSAEIEAKRAELEKTRGWRFNKISKLYDEIEELVEERKWRRLDNLRMSDEVRAVLFEKERA